MTWLTFVIGLWVGGGITGACMVYLRRGMGIIPPGPAVSPPRHESAHPDYQVDCEYVMEPAMLDVVYAAENAGWDPTTVGRAQKSNATNYMRAREANAETDTAIVSMRSGKRR